MTKWNSLPLAPLCLLGLVVPALSLQEQSNFASSGRDEWPSPAQWQSLNVALGGSLETLRPWAAECYFSDPSFDEAKCKGVISNYKNDSARVQARSALLWSNWEACGYGNGCALDYEDPQVVRGSAVCHQGAVPPRSVSIRDAQDASVVVKWAVAHKVQLIVRNTGHDFMGRSAAPNTLQVNTHRMQHLEYIADFIPQGTNANPVPAITMGAGVQLSEVYKLAGEKNVAVVLGTCPSVGAAGFMQAGGHGPLTPALGLGADHILQYELVTADGVIRTLNAVQDPVLFWAVRGGGPGSWGLITSITIKAHPATRVGTVQFVIRPADGQKKTQRVIDFIALVGRYQHGWVTKGIASSFLPGEDKYLLNLYWPSNKGDSAVLVFVDELLSRADEYTIVSFQRSTFASVTEAEEKVLGPFANMISPYGASMQMSSRLIPLSYLGSKWEEVAEAMWAGMERINAVLRQGGLGNTGPLIFGSMPAGSVPKAKETGANPALYEAAWHVMFGVALKSEIPPDINADLVAAIRDAVIPLTKMGIIGSYQAEGGAYEQNWKDSFFGSKYDALLAIKRKYDPGNFFNSYKGVDWDEDRAAYQCYAKNAPPS